MLQIIYFMIRKTCLFITCMICNALYELVISIVRKTKFGNQDVSIKADEKFYWEMTKYL